MAQSRETIGSFLRADSDGINLNASDEASKVASERGQTGLAGLGDDAGFIR